MARERVRPRTEVGLLCKVDLTKPAFRATTNREMTVARHDIGLLVEQDEFGSWLQVPPQPQTGKPWTSFFVPRAYEESVFEAVEEEVEVTDEHLMVEGDALASAPA